MTAGAAHPGREPARYFLVHLQKTAGTALQRALHDVFDDRERYPGTGDGTPPETVLSVPHLLERWNRRRGEIRFIAGHFPLCTTELLDAPFSTITVLRDPVERTLSFLRHARETEAPGEGLEALYEDPVRFELVHNHMVKMLSLSVDEMTDGALTHVEFDDARLIRARENLRSIDVVGVQERYDIFCATLEERFGWHVDSTLTMNRTSKDGGAEFETAALRERIADDNAADLELYELARELVGAGS